ncbi:MAG TPA: hypothetical protein VHE61_05635 [Opitutaceae bacterium]|nr:hypothetical protein [Opitutaceae bacterium]
MKFWFIAIALLAPWPSGISAQDRPHPETTKQTFKLLQAAMPYYLPTPRVPEPKPPANPGPVLVMEPFKVVGSHLPVGLEAKLQRQEQQAKLDRFSLTRGGVLLRAGPVEFGFMGDSTGLTLLRISW